MTKKARPLSNNQFQKFQLDSGHLVAYADSWGNCKHCTLNSINNVNLKFDLEEINNIVQHKIAFTINSQAIHIIQHWQEYFTLIGLAVLPIGYNTSSDKELNGPNQYHATFLTKNAGQSYIDRCKNLKFNLEQYITPKPRLQRPPNHTSTKQYRKH